MASLSPRFPGALYRAAQVRELDRIAIEDCGIEGFALMQKAASVAFDELLGKWPQARHLLVFVGAGNNGGDGYVLAALARNHGLNPELITVGDHDRLKGDALRASELARQRGVPLSRFDRAALLQTGNYPVGHTVVVDALLGTGLDRPVSDSFAAAIDTINDLPFPVLAIDIPSGLSSDSGSVLGVAVRAAVTVTFIGVKQGMLTAAGVDHTGDIVYNDLDVPPQVFDGEHSPAPAARRLRLSEVSSLLKPRLASANKSNFGHTVIVGGDYGYGGAVVMAAAGALRAGAGLVSVITRSANRAGMLARQPEIMLAGTEDPQDYQHRIEDLLARASAIVVGPGLGKTDWSRSLLEAVLQYQETHGIPLVVDADGLNLLADSAGTETSNAIARDNWILTPHPGEAARLLASTSDQVNADRFAAVRQVQARWGGVALLKGAGSLICSGQGENQAIELCDAGNPGMASGGMGDVLSGIIGALVSQHLSLVDSLRLAVCVHGEAADQVARERGPRGMAATDLLDPVQKLVNPVL
jgi:NAD(P)H-hydrate epimerase